MKVPPWLGSWSRPLRTPLVAERLPQPQQSSDDLRKTLSALVRCDPARGHDDRGSSGGAPLGRPHEFAHVRDAEGRVKGGEARRIVRAVANERPAMNHRAYVFAELLAGKANGSGGFVVAFEGSVQVHR